MLQRMGWHPLGWPLLGNRGAANIDTTNIGETGLLHLKDDAGETVIRAWQTEAEQ